MLTLVRGNLSALRSDRAALGLVAVGAMVLAIAATLGAFGSFPLFFVIGFVLVPIFGTAIGAVQVSGERASGYAAVLHTAPITPGAYLGAKWLTAFLWTTLAVALTLPYGLLFALFLGPAFLAEFLPWVPVGLLLAALSASLGVLLSVLVGRRGLLPSAFAGIGIALVVALVPLFLAFLPEAMRDAAGWMTRLSPLVSVLDPQAGMTARSLETEEGWRGYGLMAAYAVLYAAIGYVLYARLQSAEGWDAPGSRIAAALGVGFLLVLAPAAIVGGNPLEPPSLAAQPPFQVQALVQAPGDPAQVQEREAFGAQTVTLRPGEPATVQLRVQAMALSGADQGYAPTPSTTPPDPLTNVVLRFRAVNGFGVTFDPPEVRIDAWEAVPCPAFEVPIEEGGPMRTVTPQGCYRYADQVIPLTMTLTAVQAFRDSNVGSLIEVRASADQGSVVNYAHANFAVDAPEFPWWSIFVVWALVVAGFAAVQAQRRARLGRKSAPAAPPRGGPPRPGRAAASPGPPRPGPGAAAPPRGRGP